MLVFLGGGACVLAAAVCAWVFLAPRLGSASRLGAVALRPEQMEGFVLSSEGATAWEAGAIQNPTSVRAVFQEWEHTASGATFRVTWAVFRSPEDAQAAGLTGGSWTQARLQPGTYSGEALGDASWHFAEAPIVGGGWVSFSSGRFAGSVNAHPNASEFHGALVEDVARRLLRNMTGPGGGG